MFINQDKSKCMLFNRARKHDFVPELYLTPGNQLEVVENMKLVGYQLHSDLRTIEEGGQHHHEYSPEEAQI